MGRAIRRGKALQFGYVSPNMARGRPCASASAAKRGANAGYEGGPALVWFFCRSPGTAVHPMAVF